MSNHHWILDVFDDIQKYARKNNLPSIEMGAVAMRSIADEEINLENSLSFQRSAATNPIPSTALRYKIPSTALRYKQ